MRRLSTLELDPETLKKVQLFHYVSMESVEGLLQHCELIELPADELLITPGRPNTNVYILLSGKLRIHLDSLDTPPVEIIHPGETVGEMSVIDQDLTSAFVVAEEVCKLIVMSEEILWSIARSSHEAAFNLLLTLTRRLRHANCVISRGVQLEKDYRRYGTVDALTGLHNRHWLERALQRQMMRCSINKRPFSIILVDVDNFKEFNDRFGHLCGDKALYTVACAFMDNLRMSETAARFGGDEFIVLLPELDLEVARLVAERLRHAVSLARFILPDGTEAPPISISLGVAQAEPDQSAESLIKTADEALYRAKECGRNTVCV